MGMTSIKNPGDDPQFFVRQQEPDFRNRDLVRATVTNQIADCGKNRQLWYVLAARPSSLKYFL